MFDQSADKRPKTATAREAARRRRATIAGLKLAVAMQKAAANLERFQGTINAND